jgi:phosphoribosylformimino-5-aminoimidazole carboxamide ribotide isomerase
MKIIPAIDIIDGKCVRLSQGDYAQKTVYNEDPLEVAKEFEDHGIRYLHLVDLDGAKSSKVVNWDVLERIATKTNLHIDFGGGVKSDEDIRGVFNAGAKQVTAGSIAVKSPETVERWINEFGGERIILGADVRNRKIAINGWLEESELEISAFLERYLKMGICTSICTDISKDGMLQGASTELYVDLLKQFPDLQLIASGGVTSIQEIIELQEKGLYGAIVGKAIYEGRIKLKELEKFSVF